MNWDELSRAPLADILAWAVDQPWCQAMADCQQDAGWHSEGDVWTHTKLVCAQLPLLDEWPALSPHDKTVLVFTALFHDSAKPLTSQIDPDSGRITSPFANDQARFLFYRQREPSVYYVPHEDYRCTVTMMSGLPGSGKDTWLATHRRDTPIVSLDDIRNALAIDATGNQGAVAQHARDRCRQLLRASTSFAFNATNLLRQTRKRWVDLFADYGARIEMVYTEPPLAAVLAQNRRRMKSVPENVIRRLAEKCEPPPLPRHTS